VSAAPWWLIIPAAIALNAIVYLFGAARDVRGTGGAVLVSACTLGALAAFAGVMWWFATVGGWAGL
jgi:hypothetical protein